MRPNILHNKLHPTDYDRIAFIEDHYEELKEMYMTIMEHLKVPASSGGNGVNIITNTITTIWYVRIDVFYFINRLSSDTEKEIFRQNCKLLVKSGGRYSPSYPVVLGIYEDNYLCFPVPESMYGSSDTYQFKVVFRPNIDNITICRTDWKSIEYDEESETTRYSDFTLSTGNTPDSYELSQDSGTSSILGSLPEKVFTEYYTTDIGKVGYSEYFDEY